MGNIIEPLNGGLVTSKDPSQLQEGELQQTQDVVYLPNDSGLHRSPGRTMFNQTAIDTITGLQYCAFDAPHVDLLVAQTGSVYATAPAGFTGNFTTLQSVKAGLSFEAIHYRNRHVLINGVNENRVLLKEGTTRQHGMFPVTTTPSITTSTTGGDWPLGADSVPNYYEYWTTEVYKVGDELIESTFQGTPATTFIADVNHYVTINRPDPLANETATHWRVYRSVSKPISVGLAFPHGFLITDDIPIESNSFTDGLKTNTGFIVPSIFDDNNPALTTWGSKVPVTWSAKTAITVDDGSYATSASTSGVNGNIAVMMLRGFSFGTIGATISNIFVKIIGYHSRSDAQIGVIISSDNGQSWTKAQTGYMGTTPDGTILFSGLWSREWTSTDFGDNFRIIVYATQTNSGTVNHSIDYLAVEIEHGGTTAEQSVAFPSCLEVAPIGRDGKGPIAYTGDIFEDSLVTNDVANPTLIAYSTQENIDSFPPIYLLSFQTKDKDTVRCIRTLGNILVVGLYSKLFRVNYLPREADAEFDRGRAIDLISADHGIVGPRAACVFQMDGRPLSLAYVSRYGIHMTDGYRATTLTDDLDWAHTVKIQDLDNCELVNDPSRYQLILFHNGKKWHFYYHPSHLKGEKLKVTGPVNYNSAAATNATLDSGALSFYTSNGGHVYVENAGLTDESGGTILPQIQTREMYMAGQGMQWQLQKLLLHQEGLGVNLSVTPIVCKTNADPRIGEVNRKIGINRGLVRFPINIMGEGITLQVAGVGEVDLTMNYLVMEAESFGTEDSLK